MEIKVIATTGRGQSSGNHASEFNKDLFMKEEQMRQLLTIEPQLHFSHLSMFCVCL